MSEFSRKYFNPILEHTFYIIPQSMKLRDDKLAIVVNTSTRGKNMSRLSLR